MDMDSLDTAKAMKAEAKKKTNKEAVQSKEIEKQKEKKVKSLHKAIKLVLQPFEKVKFVVTKQWFAGSDFYVLSKGNKDILSCVIEYVHYKDNDPDGNYSCDYMDHTILLVIGHWRGPHDTRGRFVSVADLSNEVASIMKNYV